MVYMPYFYEWKISQAKSYNIKILKFMMITANNRLLKLVRHKFDRIFNYLRSPIPGYLFIGIIFAVVVRLCTNYKLI
ncbi:hypothetical protein NIES73_29480 [Sphaerospermopsis kisseleviana NIES-73]|nr:hypothetical protein NIES73_29480 [Sphaerospermopsis kisseleviana NIES-73]